MDNRVGGHTSLMANDRLAWCPHYTIRYCNILVYIVENGVKRNKRLVDEPLFFFDWFIFFIPYRTRLVIFLFCVCVCVCALLLFLSAELWDLFRLCSWNSHTNPLPTVTFSLRTHTRIFFEISPLLFFDGEMGRTYGLSDISVRETRMYREKKGVQFLAIRCCCSYRAIRENPKGVLMVGICIFSSSSTPPPPRGAGHQNDDDHPPPQ